MSTQTATPTALSLSDPEAAQLTYHESVIEGGLKAFVTTGQSLAVISDANLYRVTHDTFEDYCRERWHLGRSTAYQYIDAASVMSAIADIAPDTLSPANEAQARELIPLKDNPEAMVEAWTAALKVSAWQPTARVVREMVSQHPSRTGVAMAPSIPGPKHFQLAEGEMTTEAELWKMGRQVCPTCHGRAYIALDPGQILDASEHGPAPEDKVIEQVPSPAATPLLTDGAHKCLNCAGPLPEQHRGQPRKYCSDNCRQKGFQKAKKATKAVA